MYSLVTFKRYSWLNKVFNADLEILSIFFWKRAISSSHGKLSAQKIFVVEEEEKKAKRAAAGALRQPPGEAGH